MSNLFSRCNIPILIGIDSNDAAEEYTVEFAVQYWEPIINNTDVANAKEDTENDG